VSGSDETRADNAHFDSIHIDDSFCLKSA